MESELSIENESQVLQQPLITQGQMISQRAKLLVGLSSKEWGNYKRTRQGALAALLLYIYFYIMIRTTTMCLSHVHPPCFYLKATMPYSCALMSYSLISITICVHHEELMFLDVIPNPNSFQTLSNPSRLLVLPDHSRLYHMTSRSHALHPLQTNNYYCPISVLTLTLPEVCSHTHLIIPSTSMNLWDKEQDL